MNDNSQKSNGSWIDIITNSILNFIVVIAIAVLGNARFVHQLVVQNLAVGLPVASIALPDNRFVRVAVTFLFWMVVGGLCYVILVVGKSLISVINEEYHISHYVNHPSNEALLGDSIAKLLSWVVFVITIALLIFTIIAALLPSARVLMADPGLVSAAMFLGFALVCVFFMRIAAAYSYVIRG